MQTRNMSGVFIQILVTCTLDPVTGSSSEEMASARQSSSIASGASNNTNASRAKSARPIMDRNHEMLEEGGE